jgi:hypothetical protein
MSVVSGKGYSRGGGLAQPLRMFLWQFGID